MAFELATVTAHIADLNITGVKTINDFDGVKDTADLRECPILQPDVTKPIEMQSIERNSFGDGPVAKQTLMYIIPYVLLYAPVGAERNLNKILPALVTIMSRVVTALIENDTPSDKSVDMQIAAFTLGGTVGDPSGQQFHGVSISVVIKEFVN